MLRGYLAIIGISIVVSQVTYENIVKKLNQNDYQIKYERTVVVRYNTAIFKNLDVHGFKYNRTSFAINGTFTLNINLNSDLMLLIQCYKYLSNEYRYFPIRVQLPFCDLFYKNLMGFGDISLCGNFTGCPLRKGSWHFCNFMNDFSKYPPLIPNGRYKMEFQATYLTAEAFVVDGYAEITRPLAAK